MKAGLSVRPAFIGQRVMSQRAAMSRDVINMSHSYAILKH